MRGPRAVRRASLPSHLSTRECDAEDESTLTPDMACHILPNVLSTLQFAMHVLPAASASATADDAVRATSTRLFEACTVLVGAILRQSSASARLASVLEDHSAVPLLLEVFNSASAAAAALYGQVAMSWQSHLAANASAAASSKPYVQPVILSFQVSGRDCLALSCPTASLVPCRSRSEISSPFRAF